MGIWDRIRKFFEELLEDIRGFIAGNGGLRITVVSGPTDVTNCGAASYQVRWSLRDITKTGWIIQHVRFESRVTDCRGKPKPSNTPNGLEYWEGWEVSGGKVWVGFATGGAEHSADTFQTVDEGADTKGTSAIRGKVRFVENFGLTTPPWGYTVPQSGALPTLTPPAEPDGWSDVGADAHELVVSWVCCDGTEEQSTTTHLGPSLIQRILDVMRRLFSRALGGKEPSPRIETEELSPMVNDAIDLLNSIPAWSEIAPNGHESRQEVIAKLSQLSKNDSEVLRDVISRYVDRKKASATGYDVAAMSRLYLLNRVLFNVSDRAKLGSPRFGSFAGIPYGEDWVNELWPLSVDDRGNLHLTGQFGGYFGESYLAVQEFEHFARTFARRRVQDNP